MQSEDGELNSAHKLHLLSSAQHADKLLSDVESILSASKSKSPFRKYRGSLSTAQAKVVEDYIGRIRTQLVRVLESQGIPLPKAAFESVHSMRVTLAFVRIAFQECTANRMQGYGAVPQSKVLGLNGLVDEMVAAVEKLDSYLARGLAEDLTARLERLAASGSDVGLINAMERIVADYGFVEFRPALSLIVDRFETKHFEIAFFGRVSSGKSSLLNHIVDSEILPVGVNPITAVPTRLAYGERPRLTVWYADRSAEVLDIVRLPEFVSEQHNPANYKHVTRILVELPAPRLRDGVVLVDTPGLGSLASAGAMETLAYLPRCDMGVVLIDGGSTLTEDDLVTIRTLYEAGIPASVLLSKSDLLADEDQIRSAQYITGQISAQLGLTMAVDPVSIQSTHLFLLEDWLREVILPLYDRHQQLARESLSRKIGSLREALAVALKARLDHAEEPAECIIDRDAIDGGLRTAVGRMAEVREACLAMTHDVRSQAGDALTDAATRLTDTWSKSAPVSSAAIVHDAITQVAADRANKVFQTLNQLAQQLAQSLQLTAEALGFAESHREEDLTSAIKEMPKLDLGPIEIEWKPGLFSKLSRNLAIRQAEKALERQIGERVSEAFSIFGSILDAWARRTLSEMQLRFETPAESYRTHLDRIGARGRISVDEISVIERDLALLSVDT
jgi:GTP-binding protein EngB required for normal cell division